MKKVAIISSLCMLFAIASTAQSYSGFMRSPTSTRANVDTVKNTATVSQTITVTNTPSIVALQPVVTKLTGTVGGVIRVFGSLDGKNFVRINNTDSLVVTNIAMSTKIFTIPTPYYAHYRLTFTGTGTQTSTLQTFAVWRKL
jgi:hypothetical protein